jgi:2-polyprenyl-6-methoxyphenol hydroxylase-like FAD-dependent oxidoreductase
MKIAIVGAGFAGLSATIGLNGHDITIFEQAPELKPVGAGVLLQPFGLHLLNHLGVLNNVLESGDRIDRLYGLNQRNRVILNLRYNRYQADYYGVGIHRGNLFRLLFDKAMTSNPQVVTGAQVLHIERMASKSRIHLSDGPTEAFDLIIVANGSKSMLRGILPDRKLEAEYPWGALWGVFDNPGYNHDTLYQRYHGTEKLFGILPCGKNPVTGKDSFSLFWSLHKDQHPELMNRGLEDFKHSLGRFDPLAEKLLPQINSWEQLSFVTYLDIYLKQWMTGNVLFIGDCAHGMSPQLGLGANMAIYDGLLIGEILKANHDEIASLHQLRKIRHQQNLFYHRVSRLMTPFFQSGSNVRGWVRDMTFPLLPNIPFLDRMMVETLYGTRSGLFSRIYPGDAFSKVYN